MKLINRNHIKIKMHDKYCIISSKGKIIDNIVNSIVLGGNIIHYLGNNYLVFIHTNPILSLIDILNQSKVPYKLYMFKGKYYYKIHKKYIVFDKW